MSGKIFLTLKVRRDTSPEFGVGDRVGGCSTVVGSLDCRKKAYLNKFLKLLTSSFKQLVIFSITEYKILFSELYFSKVSINFLQYIIEI